MNQKIAFFAFIVIVAVLAIYVYNGGDFGLPLWLTPEPVTYYITGTCTGGPLDTVHIYDHFTDAGKDKYRGTPEVMASGYYEDKISSDAVSVLICDESKWLMPDGRAVDNIDLNNNVASITGVPVDYSQVIVNTDADCNVISDSTLLSHSGSDLLVLISQTNCEPEPPPEETCYDGMLNQDETGIDCGGVCPACDVPPPPDEFPWLPVLAGIVVVALILLGWRYA